MGAACCDAWKAAIPASHWDVQVILRELERLCTIVCQVTHMESITLDGRSLGEGAWAGHPPMEP